MQAMECGSRIVPSIGSKGLDCYIPDRSIRLLPARNSRSLAHAQTPSAKEGLTSHIAPLLHARLSTSALPTP